MQQHSFYMKQFLIHFEQYCCTWKPVSTVHIVYGFQQDVVLQTFDEVLSQADNTLETLDGLLIYLLKIKTRPISH